VDVVGPAVQENDHRTVARACFGIADAQHPGIDLLDGPERRARPRLGRRRECQLPLAGCFRGPEDAELGGGKGHGRGATEAAASGVELVGDWNLAHVSASFVRWSILVSRWSCLSAGASPRYSNRSASMGS